MSWKLRQPNDPEAALEKQLRRQAGLLTKQRRRPPPRFTWKTRAMLLTLLILSASSSVLWTLSTTSKYSQSTA